MVDPVRVGPVKTPGAVRTSDAPTGARARAKTADVPLATTPLPQLLTLVKELADQGPPIDHARIAQLRQAIALGSYRVDPDALASAMLNYGRSTAQ